MTLQHRRPLISALLFSLLFSVAEMRSAPQFVDLFEFEEPIYDVAFRNGSEGYALSAEDIWTTTDGGKNWIRQAIPLFHAPFTSLALLGDEGIIIGDMGGLIYLLDGQEESWQIVSHGSGKAILEIDAVDEMHWVAITDSLVVATVDGGKTFRTFAPEGRSGLSAVDMTDSLLMHVAASAFLVWRSEDGGESWTQINGGFGEIYDVRFPSRDIGFVASSYPWNLFTTTDGGKTWTPGPYEYPTTIDVISEGIGAYATADYFRLSEDGGRTWSDSLLLKDLAPEGTSEFYAINEVITPENGFVYVHASNPESDRSIVTRVDMTSDVKEQVRRSPVVLEIAHHTNR